MATTLVRDAILRAETILQDTTNTRWSKEELLNWLNDAQLAIVNRRPDTYVKNTEFVCEKGTKQALPSDGLRLMRVLRNVGGKPIRMIDINILDDQVEDWHNEVDAAACHHYCYELTDPKTFYLYPAPAAAVKVDIVYSLAPPAITISNWATDTTTITLDDSYLNAIVDWIVYRAYSKDADYAQNVNRASMHLDAFRMSIGEKTQSDTGVSQAQNQNETQRGMR